MWCTGFRQAFDWIDVPIFDAGGLAQEMRGVVDASPGLYFCGLGFQYAAASMLIVGAVKDATPVRRRAHREAHERPDGTRGQHYLTAVARA